MPCAVVRITLYLQYLILNFKVLGTDICPFAMTLLECPYAEIAVTHY